MAPEPDPSLDTQSKIFISYRREDNAAHAGRLFDRLQGLFPGRVFIDIDTLPPGVDFIDAVDRAVRSCEVLLVLIGRRWLTTENAAGGRRLDDPSDIVRLEVATALRQDVRVVPVLLQDARMPRADDLPEELAKLSRRNAIEISDARWAYDVERLIETVRDAIAPIGSTDAEPGPPIAQSRETSPAVPRQMAGMRAWLALLTIAVGAWILLESSLERERGVDPSATSATAVEEGGTLDNGAIEPMSDFPGGSTRVYSADFSTWPRPVTELGTVSLAFGNSYVLEPATDSWIGPGQVIEIPTLAADFVLDLRFRIEGRDPSAALSLTLLGEGPDADSIGASVGVWNDAVTYSLLRGRKRSGSNLETAQAIVEETLADRKPVPPAIKDHDWSRGSKLTFKREGGRLQLFVNNIFLEELGVPRYPIREIGVGAARKSRIVLTSLETRSP